MEKGKKIWVVTFPKYSSQNRLRTYYKESRFLKAISKYKGKVNVKIYDLYSEEDGIGAEIHEGLLKSKIRDSRLASILEGKEDKIKNQ